MNNHRFILEPYKSLKSRFVCPNCQKREKTFSLYIDTESGEHLAPNVGRCNSESSCGYHYSPKQYFEDNNIKIDNKDFVPRSRTFVLPKPKNTSYIDSSVFKQSLQGYEKNNFVEFLNNRFGAEATTQAIERYFIGTSKHWNGATIFWEIDVNGRIRTGKIMLYNTETCKRVKEPFNHIHWVHSLLKIDNYELEQCYFGEHLLKDKIKPIAIVESEKTAIISSMYLPNFIWLAVGSLTNLNKGKCEVLRGRNVVLFPDTDGFEKWSVKAKEFNFKVSDLLERKATDEQKKQGLDIADYLLNFDIKDFTPILTESTVRLNNEPPPPMDWQPMEDWGFSEESREAFRIMQGRSKLDTRSEVTKQEFKNFVQTDYQNSIDKHFNR
jgi:rubredoxin